MSNNTIQAHFNETSVILINKTLKIIVFMSPKSPKSHQTFVLNNNLESLLGSSILKRYLMIKELLSKLNNDNKEDDKENLSH